MSTAPDEIVFHTNPMSRGRIVRWMLEELGVDYRPVVQSYGAIIAGPDRDRCQGRQIRGDLADQTEFTELSESAVLLGGCLCAARGKGHASIS